MTNRQLLALAKMNPRMPKREHTDKETGKVVPHPFFVANPNAYKRADMARAELTRLGF